MRRLFWKFFAIAALVQVLITVGVATAVWHHVRDRMSGDEPPAFEDDRPPPPMPMPGVDRRPGPDGPPPPPPPDVMPPPHHGDAHGGGPPLLPIEPLIGGILASLLCAALMARYIARPIELLRASFASVSAGNLRVRIGDAIGGRRDEVADLARAFDATVARLETILRGQERLLHDVSHEMRSPLARIQAALDLARQQPENFAQSIARIERDAARMDRLVGELLTLARIDGAAPDSANEEVDAAELMTGILDDAAYEAKATGCALEVRGAPPAATIRGNAELLLRAIENIVRNALRFAGSGGTVEVAFEAAFEPPLPQGLRIAISDTGPGVAPKDLAAIFEPFYRGEAARSPDGFGLGLALAKRIVDMHGGSIDARNLERGGLRVAIVLPLVTPPARPAAPATRRSRA